MWILRKTKIKLWLLWENIIFQEKMFNKYTKKILKLQVDKTYQCIYDDLNYFKGKKIG